MLKVNLDIDNKTPEARLVLAIIAAGLKDMDDHYIASRTFEMHANLLGLDPEILRDKYDEIKNRNDSTRRAS